MKAEDKKLLEDDGWDIDCESPFEISDKDGSSAAGRAADYVLDYLRDCANSSLSFCMECEEEIPEGKRYCDTCDPNKVPDRKCMECGKPATNTMGNLCNDHEHMAF